MSRRGLQPSGLAAVLLLVGWAGLVPAQGLPSTLDATRRFVGLYCSECHNADDRASGLDLDTLASEPIDRHPGAWEKVVRRVGARQMPPEGSIRPRSRESDTFAASIAGILDRSAADHPEPGRTETFRRLTRSEYQNAIRDLLGLDIDASTLLPADESSRGFDNITVGDLSPTFLDRAITAAQQVARLAVGADRRTPGGDTFRVRADVTQEEHLEGLPIGTRGGIAIPYTFPQDGEYDIQARLARDRNEHVEGLREPHEVEFLVDRERVALRRLTPPKSEREHQSADDHLKVRVRVTAGAHQVGVTFLKQPSDLLETKRQPFQAHYNMHRHPRLTPALFQVSITGPYGSKGHGDPPSRRHLFIREPTGPDDEEACAREILAKVVRRAFRRPIAEDDLVKPMTFYREGRSGGSFDAGIESALASVLVSPQFLFRIEPDPPGIPPRTAYRLPAIQLASRLSFFLWSSIPDDELLGLAEKGELGKPGVLDRQVRRMLADPKSRSLVDNFAGQWLQLRNLESITPDLRLFPDFDDNLRQSFRRETELLFEEIIREDRSVLELLKPDHAYLDERLAKHYGIAYVHGSHFRRVPIVDGIGRGGLLRQGSILMVTSYANRTSPVLRGKWVLENILGTPPPPQPPNVPTLKDNTVSSTLSVRERLAEHRKDVACAGCHRLLDPPGFALENFDAVGRWRGLEEGKPVDSTGGLPDGSKFDGVDGLEAAILKRPELFVGTLTEKLMTFALGRGVEPSDAPAVRAIVRKSRESNNSFSTIIVGIATSTPFTMRRSE